VFETKWDGFRLVARIEKGSVTLYSRGGLIVSDKYKPIAKALEKVGPPPMKWSDSKYGHATEEDCNGEEAQA
jgi:hypothetical protein